MKTEKRKQLLNSGNLLVQIMENCRRKLDSHYNDSKESRISNGMQIHERISPNLSMARNGCLEILVSKEP